jgi:hypothetical protein
MDTQDECKQLNQMQRHYTAKLESQLRIFFEDIIASNSHVVGASALNSAEACGVYSFIVSVPADVAAVIWM